MADEKKTKDRDHLNDMLIEWAPLINFHANSMKDGLPPHIFHEDLFTAGMHGLIDAFHKYDSAKGASFKTHASTRIKHKMKDHISSDSNNAVDKIHYTKAKQSAAPKVAPVEAPGGEDIKPTE